MPRTARKIVGGYAYHVLNRANGRLRLFRKEADFAAFEQIIAQAHDRVPLRILAYVVMGNHWHFVVWPRRGREDEVAGFFRWLSITHAQRWHAAHGTSGMGHVYQGRYKSFPVATDEHLLAVLRYVERNPLRAKLVKRAEAWQWGSLYRRTRGTPEERRLLTDSPVPLGSDWLRHVNRPQLRRRSGGDRRKPAPRPTLRRRHLATKGGPATRPRVHPPPPRPPTQAPHRS